MYTRGECVGAPTSRPSYTENSKYKLGRRIQISYNCA